MDYKLIAIDLDDSLLGSDLKISSGNKMAIEKAMEGGVLVTIATGRMFQAVLSYSKELGLDIPLITYQGGLIKSAISGEVLYNQTLSIDISKEIIRRCQKDNIYIQAYIGDDYYFEKECEYSRLYHNQVKIRGVEVGPMDEFLEREPNKLLIIDRPERVIGIREEYGEVFGDRLEVSTSKPEFVEFTHKDATKGKALEVLAGLKAIPREKIIAIGDSYNDLSMIQYAGLGVAMGNAPERVKSFADYVTSKNDEDGVAKVISKFILKGG